MKTLPALGLLCRCALCIKTLIGTIQGREGAANVCFDGLWGEKRGRGVLLYTRRLLHPRSSVPHKLTNKKEEMGRAFVLHPYTPHFQKQRTNSVFLKYGENNTVTWLLRNEKQFWGWGWCSGGVMMHNWGARECVCIPVKRVKRWKQTTGRRFAYSSNNCQKVFFSYWCSPKFWILS